MLKLSIVLIVAATCVAACEASPTTNKGWVYERTHDALRQRTVTTARLESNETWGENPRVPKVTLTIIKGSAADDGVTMYSASFECGLPTLLRVDDHPIETIESRGRGYCLDLPLHNGLAKRIMSSKEVVAEIGGAGGPQITFKTEGLDLTNGRGRE